ncbi:hypothetical protein NPS01_14990 [Nocardioides psychrotolerans]|uniref:Competence protein ComEA n=1 Tax=Nocardioides psychrotolerans TaxID=1005945 RepID=A0A1I3F5Z3_9ACTN|nr:ComEA family DNA-binding protein [Nocardioides psychrotolerans]GEP37836.1 hypothetical protein NPS01_14990 [Nocardioides psychrotolerans]SFI06637.1 competence protein ComEA [Nocardioides psychrotolerans]
MRSRRSSQDHDAAVARRLEQLRAELAATRGGQEGASPEALAVVEPAAGGEWWDGHTRVAGARRPLVVVPPFKAPHEEPRRSETAETAAEPPWVPVPGRHAARRRRPGLADALPDTLRGRVGLGVAQVAVLAVLVAIGLALTTWWVVRGDPEVAPTTAPVVTPAGAELVALPAASAPPTGAGTAGATTVTVDVAGKVRRPGIAVLDTGSRVVDALEAAGGARPGVDLSWINLARLLVDGEQILVGRPPSVTTPAVPGLTGAVPGATGPLVNLNLATQAELETLPEVGPVTAQSILAWRDEHGGFSAVEELLEVDGIGDATLEQIAPFVTI